MGYQVERNKGDGWVPIALIPRNRLEAENIARVLSRCDTVGLEGEYRVTPCETSEPSS